MSEAVPNTPKNQVGAGQQPGIELLAAIVASSGDAIVSLDLEGYITGWNSAARHLFGFTPQEAIGIHAAFLLRPAHLRRQAIRSIDQLKGGAGPFHYESQLQKKDGTLVAVSVTAFGVRNAAGELIGIAAIYRDISRFFATARDVGQQKELERERSQLASIVNSSDEAIYSEAPDGTVNSWNGGAEKLFGYSATEIVGRNITLCIPQERRAESLKHLRRVLRKEGIQQFQTVRRRKDGGLVDVSITMSPIIDSAGAVSGLAVIARDITQRRQFEEQLTKARDEALEAARLKSEFLANMSHEIRTPLNSMVGLGAMLLDTKLGVEQQALVREMQDTNEGLLAIINDILDFSKMSVGKLIFEVVDFELEKVVAATLSLLAAPSRKKGLEVAMWIEPGTPKILRGDPGRLRQVLANLVSNAVKFTEQGEIQVRAAKVNESPDDATLRFEVRDPGIGIAAEEQTQIFRAFTQVGDRRHEGTGLGLAIASRLVEQMGGSIGVLSAPGAGSTFWFTANFGKSSIAVVSKTAALASKLGLPPAITGVGAPAIIGDAAALEFAGASGRKPRILLAEDNASNRKVALWQLDKLGCSADVVTNGVEALEALARSSYDVVLMDCRMPQMDGNEATRQIRRREGSARHTWIVAMTAHALEQDKKKCLEAGMDDYLTKPVTLESLANTLRRVLGEKADPASSPPRAIAEPPPDAVPAPVVDAVPPPVVDAATMASLRAKGDLLPGLIDTVMVEIPEQLTEIGDALARRDFAGAAVAAHSLRGTARLFGAARMDELAAAVEQAADEEETETAAAQLQRLREECGRVTGELRIERANPALQIH